MVMFGGRGPTAEYRKTLSITTKVDEKPKSKMQMEIVTKREMCQITVSRWIDGYWYVLVLRCSIEMH